jgi:16S rRNA (adenine1518-N6/adenine1519-N6)-dimethyltransferase
MGQRLGQHFLKNQAAIKKIIAALDLKKGEQIIEIGPGRGALTIPLIKNCSEKNCQVIAVEKDEELAMNLEAGIRNYGEIVKIIHGDILKNLPSIIHNSKFIIQNWLYLCRLADSQNATSWSSGWAD